MKLLSTILAMLVVFLTVQPLITNSISSSEKKLDAARCCAAKQQPVKKDNNRCSNGQCDNPFLTCGCSYFINQENASFSAEQTLISNQKIRLINDKVLSAYIQDFWHPPETV